MNPSVAMLWDRAAGHFAAGRLDAARATLDALLAQEPHNAVAWLALAQVDTSSGSVRRSAEHALAAARQPVADPALLCEIATALLSVGADGAARACVERAAVLLQPDAAALRQRIALQYQNIGMHDEALAWMERARAAGLDDPANRFCYAIQLTFHARVAEAERVLETCVDVRPPFGRAMAQLAQLRRQTPERNHLQRLGEQLAGVTQGSEDHAALEFARYKEYEDLGHDGEAWDALQRGNALMHALLRHDSTAEARTFQMLAEQVHTLPVQPAPARRDGPVPIFIIGLPRSGTTLLDRLIGNHTEVHSAGELGTFRRCLQRAADRFTGPMLDETFVERLTQVDCAELGELYLAHSQWHAHGRRFYVDKMPRNWLLVPLIHAALPEARILHMVREPMDVTFSNYRAYFGGDYAWCYDVDALVRHYAGYRRLMREWHARMPGVMLDVPYHDLVSEPEAALRRVFDFCGLAWQPDCLDIARNSAPVATPSAVQVRSGIDADRSEHWRRYATYLEPLRSGIAAVLAELA